MKVLNFKDFMKKYNLKNDTMNESQLQKSYNYPIYPRDSKIFLDREFVKIDNGSQGGSHWTAFYVENKKSYYFDSFGGQPDKFLLNQLPKPTICHNYKIQDKKFQIMWLILFIPFYLIERMNYYDTILKLVFE